MSLRQVIIVTGEDLEQQGLLVQADVQLCDATQKQSHQNVTWPTEFILPG